MSHDFGASPTMEDSVTLKEVEEDSSLVLYSENSTLNVMTTKPHAVTSIHDNVTSSDDVINNVTVIDYEAYLDHLNAQFAELMLPAITYLGVLMLMGLIGNCLVLYIYLRKFKHNTTRSFVVALAAFDLISCTVAIPGEVIDLLHNYTFGSYITCKLLRTVNSFSAFASGLTLFVVAVDRYKRICNPLGRHISTKSANFVLLCCCLVSMALAAPASFLYGSRTITTHYVWINGSDCSTSDMFIGTWFPLIYNGVQFLFFVVGAFGLMALYSLIGRRVWRHRKFKVAGQPPSFFMRCSDSGSETSPATDDGHAPGYISPSTTVPSNTPRDPKQNGMRRPPRKLSIKIFNRSSVSGMSDPSSPETLSPESPTWLLPKPEMNRKVSRDQSSIMRKMSMRRGTIDRRQSILPNLTKRESNARRTTLMLFLITLIFILSFLPHLVLMAIKAIDKESLSGSGDLSELAFNIGLRSYFINSVANPIVYGLCCQKFRTEVVKLLKCTYLRK